MVVTRHDGKTISISDPQQIKLLDKNSKITCPTINLIRNSVIAKKYIYK